MARPLRNRVPRRIVVGSALALVMTAVGGGAAAYWSHDGLGAGSASTGAPAAVSLSPGEPAAQLHPGSTSDVVLTVDNPNAATVRVAALTLDETSGTGGISVDVEHAACDESAFAFVSPTTGAGWTLPGDSSTAVTLPEALTMSLDASDACQGVRVTVHLGVAP